MISILNDTNTIMFSTTNNTTSLFFSPQPQQNLFSFNNSNSKKFTNSENCQSILNSENSSFITNKINLFSTDLFNQNSLKNMIIKNLT